MLITPKMVQEARTKLQVPIVLIEDDATDIIIDYTVKELSGVLAELEAMTPLPRPTSPEATAHHDAWMAQSEQMSQLARKAQHIALVTVPEEVQKVLHAITARELVLMGITLA